MRPIRMHADQIDTSPQLVRRLLHAQFPQWASLPVTPVESFGTDHDIYRVGADLVARLPRIGWALDQAEKERHWLPVLAPCLPLTLPVQLARGVPAEGYPYEWSVYEWLPGDSAVASDDIDRTAADLARFISALQAIDTTGAPPRGIGSRGGAHAERDEAVRNAIAELGDRIDAAMASRVWESALAADGWDDDVWVHGDLLPGNLIVRDLRLSAVIDWGALNVGDPACDLLPAWNLFTGTSRDVFREQVGADDAAWERGRGWALSQAVVALPYYWSTNPGMVRQASYAVAQLVGE